MFISWNRGFAILWGSIQKITGNQSPDRRPDDPTTRRPDGRRVWGGLKILRENEIPTSMFEVGTKMLLTWNHSFEDQLEKITGNRSLDDPTYLSLRWAQNQRSTLGSEVDFCWLKMLRENEVTTTLRWGHKYYVKSCFCHSLSMSDGKNYVKTKSRRISGKNKNNTW